MRPIDQIRDSAMSMKIGGPDDGRIVGMVPLADKMLVVMERAIHAMQLADGIDPGRTNIDIPNTQQKVLGRGATDPIVAKTLLTAQTLFKKVHLGSDFDEEQGLALVFDLLKDVSAMADMLSALDAAQQAAIERHEKNQSPQARTLTLPTIGDAEARCHAFTQKIGHAVDTLRDIARLFYGEALTKKWIDALAEIAKERYGSEHPFTKYLESVRPHLLLWRELRNMVEHPKSDWRVAAFDFQLMPSGDVMGPSVEIIRPEAEALRGSLASFMEQLVQGVSDTAEGLIALFCGAHVQPLPPFAIQIVELPEDQRANPLVRYSYGSIQGDQVIRIG